MVYMVYTVHMGDNNMRKQIAPMCSEHDSGAFSSCH